MQPDIYMGLFGFSWQEKVGKAMYKILGSDYKKVLHDFWQPSQTNVRLVNNIYGFYLLEGSTRATADALAAKAKVDFKVAQAFIVAVRDLALKGNIPYKIYDPETAQATAEVKAKLLAPKGLQEAKTFLTLGLLVAGGLVLSNLLSTVKKVKGA